MKHLKDIIRKDCFVGIDPWQVPETQEWPSMYATFLRLLGGEDE